MSTIVFKSLCSNDPSIGTFNVNSNLVSYLYTIIVCETSNQNSNWLTPLFIPRKVSLLLLTVTQIRYTAGATFIIQVCTLEHNIELHVSIYTCIRGGICSRWLRCFLLVSISHIMVTWRQDINLVEKRFVP